MTGAWGWHLPLLVCINPQRLMLAVLSVWVHSVGLQQNVFCYQTLVQPRLFFINLSSSHERKPLQLCSYMKYCYLLSPPQQGLMLFKVSLTTAFHQHGLQQIHHNTLHWKSSLKSREGLLSGVQNTEWSVTKIMWKTTYRRGTDADSQY